MVYSKLRLKWISCKGYGQFYFLTIIFFFAFFVKLLFYYHSSFFNITLLFYLVPIRHFELHCLWLMLIFKYLNSFHIFYYWHMKNNYYTENMVPKFFEKTFIQKQNCFSKLLLTKVNALFQSVCAQHKMMDVPILSSLSIATVSKALLIMGYSSSTSLKLSTEREYRRQ